MFPISFLKLLDKRALQELIKEVDPLMQIDEEVEDVCYFQLFSFSMFPVHLDVNSNS
jgi:hypothetical protein